jgi:hypothetical protein
MDHDSTEVMASGGRLIGGGMQVRLRYGHDVAVDDRDQSDAVRCWL